VTHPTVVSDLPNGGEKPKQINKGVVNHLPQPLTGQRRKITARIEELQPQASNVSIARALRIDEKTVRRDAEENGGTGNKSTKGLGIMPSSR
jgi:hypothetical protein